MEFDTFVIIATAVILVVAYVTASGRRNAARMLVRSCRNCGAGHPGFAQFCRRCGQRL